MMPVSLESTDYHDLRSKWFRVSHEPGLFVVEGTSDVVKHEIHKLRTHWQDKVIQIAVGDPYATLPLIYQLNPFQPIDDLVACKNALLRFQRSGWTPGNRKWVLVEVSSYLHPADLGAIHYILYRQKLRGVSVVLFFIDIQPWRIILRIYPNFRYLLSGIRPIRPDVCWKNSYKW